MTKMTGMTELEKKARKSAAPRSGIGGEAAGGQSGLRGPDGLHRRAREPMSISGAPASP